MGDWADPYLTMDFAAEATIVAELLKFAASGQLYRGAKPVMWSPVEKTALAEAEVEYADIVSTQIDVAFEIVEAPNAPELVGALCRHLDDDAVDDPGQPGDRVWGGGRVCLAATLSASDPERGVVADALRLWSRHVSAGLRCGDESPTPTCVSDAVSFVGLRVNRCFIQQRVRGSDLAGAIARHPMHALGGFFAGPRPFLAGDFVTTEQGTGLVHMAPDHGEDDFLLCRANGIDPVFAVEGDGRYRADWGWLAGRAASSTPSSTPPTGRCAATSARRARCSRRAPTIATATRTAGAATPS